MTNQQLIERYTRSLERSGKSPKTIRSYVGTIAKHTTKPFTSVTGFDLEDFVESMGNNSPSTINQRINALKGFYKYLFEMGVIDRNPTSTINLLPVEETKKDWTLLSIDKYKELINNKYIDKDMRVAIAISAFAGLRTEEICNLKLEHIDFSNNTILVVNGKGGKTATVPMNEYLKDFLLINISGEYAVYNKQMKPMSPTNLQQRFATIRKKFNLPSDLHMHSGRHSLATTLINKGVPLTITSKILRHASTAVTEQIYVHSCKETNLEAINAIF